MASKGTESLVVGGLVQVPLQLLHLLLAVLTELIAALDFDLLEVIVRRVLLKIQRIYRFVVEVQRDLLFLRRAILLLTFAVAIHFGGSVHKKIGTASAGLDGLCNCNFVSD